MSLYTRRRFIQVAGMGAAGLAAAACGATGGGSAGGTQLNKKAVSGNLQVWDVSATPDAWGVQQQTDFYTKYFPSLYPKLNFSYTMLGYTDLIQKLTVAWRGGATPDLVRMVNAGSPQFVGEGLTVELNPSQFGLKASDFWPQALQTVRKNGSTKGPLYGLPSNNEAMCLFYNKDLFQQAGLDPSHGPATWEDLAAYSNTIHQKTGKYGYGLVGVVNNGNTPYRFCPLMWAYGGSIFDEFSKNPTWKKIGINSKGTVEALQLYNRMFNVDKSVQPSALSDQESDVSTLFQQGKVAMMIDHPSAAEQVMTNAPNIRIGGDLIPAGPVRRSVVFGGWNLLINKNSKNINGALAFVDAYLHPEWNTRLAGLGSNPGNRQGFNSSIEKTRDKMLPFNDLTLKMMPYGTNVPLVTQGAQIWNYTIPNMIQSVLLKKSSAQDAAKEAAAQIKQIMAA